MQKHIVAWCWLECVKMTNASGEFWLYGSKCVYLPENCQATSMPVVVLFGNKIKWI